VVAQAETSFTQSDPGFAQIDFHRDLAKQCLGTAIIVFERRRCQSKGDQRGGRNKSMGTFEPLDRQRAVVCPQRLETATVRLTRQDHGLGFSVGRGV
jgi:hypothetical protein